MFRRGLQLIAMKTHLPIDALPSVTRLRATKDRDAYDLGSEASTLIFKGTIEGYSINLTSYRDCRLPPISGPRFAVLRLKKCANTAFYYRQNRQKSALTPKCDSALNFVGFGSGKFTKNENEDDLVFILTLRWHQFR